MKVWLERRFDGTIVPSTEMDEQRLKKIKANTGFCATIKEIRNYENHKRFRKFVAVILENQEKYVNEEDLIVELKIRAGHYREHIKHNGEIVYIPKSLSFDSIDEHDFRDFFKKAIQPGIDIICAGHAPEDEQYFADLVLHFA